MLRSSRMRLALALVGALLPVLIVPCSFAQDDPNDAPLGDVARNLRKKTPPVKPIIDDDNLQQAMAQGESKRPGSSALTFSIGGDGKSFHVATPEATCSLSFSANAKSLLSSQYSQMDLPPEDMAKLNGPAAIEGDALTVSLFNGTDWHVSEVVVALTVLRKNAPAEAALRFGMPAAAKLDPALVGSFQTEIRPERNPDTTVIYRMRAPAPPSMTAVFSAPLKLDLAPEDEWHWAIVQAKGYPPSSYSASASHPSILNELNVTTPAGVPPSLQEPLPEPAAPGHQSSQ